MNEITLYGKHKKLEHPSSCLGISSVLRRNTLREKQHSGTGISDQSLDLCFFSVPFTARQSVASAFSSLATLSNHKQHDLKSFHPLLEERIQYLMILSTSAPFFRFLHHELHFLYGRSQKPQTNIILGAFHPLLGKRIKYPIILSTFTPFFFVSYTMSSLTLQPVSQTTTTTVEVFIHSKK